MDGIFVSGDIPNKMDVILQVYRHEDAQGGDRDSSTAEIVMLFYGRGGESVGIVVARRFGMHALCTHIIPLHFFFFFCAFILFIECVRYEVYCNFTCVLII